MTHGAPDPLDHLGLRPDGLLTINEVADLLRCSTKTIRRRIRDGRLRVITAATNRLLFRYSDLVAYVSSNGQGQSSNPLGAACDGSDGISTIASELAD